MSAASVHGPPKPVLHIADEHGVAVRAVVRYRHEARLGDRSLSFHHAEVGDLEPDSRYRYVVSHGMWQGAGSFRTAPARAGGFRFTVCGDMGTPLSTGGCVDPHTSAYVEVVPRLVEVLDPLFQVVVGDLAYANLSADPDGTWDRFLANIERSARYRPWMMVAGNHENEPGHGFRRFQQRFRLPDNGSERHRGLWYGFTVGNARFIALNGDDVSHQQGSKDDIHGYSEGEQLRWLEAELAAAHLDGGLDWIIVLLHQPLVSSAQHNGGDLGLRLSFGPLFDRYGVDLVISGHEHNYERSWPLRGHLQGSPLRTPVPAAGAGRQGDELSSEHGTTHLVIGCGGAPPANAWATGLAGEPEGLVTRRHGPVGAATVEQLREPATWSAVRNDLRRAPYGLACFDVDPYGDGALTTITVNILGHDGRPATLPFSQDRFRLVRRRGVRAARASRQGRSDGT